MDLFIGPSNKRMQQVARIELKKLRERGIAQEEAVKDKVEAQYQVQ